MHRNSLHNGRGPASPNPGSTLQNISPWPMCWHRRTSASWIRICCFRAKSRRRGWMCQSMCLTMRSSTFSTGRTASRMVSYGGKSYLGDLSAPNQILKYTASGRTDEKELIIPLTNSDGTQNSVVFARKYNFWASCVMVSLQKWYHYNEYNRRSTKCLITSTVSPRWKTPR